jgi:uncharacterized protein
MMPRAPWPARRHRAARRWPRLWLAAAFAVVSGAHAADCREVGSAPLPAGAARFDKGLLWKIESPGSMPSHLFGTIHLSDRRVTLLPCPVKQRFDGAASYTMEVIASGAGLVSMAEAMFFNDDRRLDQVLDAELYAQTVEVLRNQGMSAEGIRKMKPWAVILTLSMPVPNGSGLFLDMALQIQAILQGKPTYGLESMDEQIAVFNELSLEHQVSLLRETLRTHREIAAQIEELTLAYLDRDLGRISAIEGRNRPADDRAYRALMERLLDRRNRVMVERMAPRLKEGNAFIAVGALHLPGDAGLLNLLSQAGYKLSPVY